MNMLRDATRGQLARFLLGELTAEQLFVWLVEREEALGQSRDCETRELRVATVLLWQWLATRKHEQALKHQLEQLLHHCYYFGAWEPYSRMHAALIQEASNVPGADDEARDMLRLFPFLIPIIADIRQKLGLYYGPHRTQLTASWSEYQPSLMLQILIGYDPAESPRQAVCRAAANNWRFVQGYWQARRAEARGFLHVSWFYVEAWDAK